MNQSSRYLQSPRNNSKLKQAKLVSKLYFIDLAGSERIKKSKVEGQNLHETNSINLSLTTLGKCIRALGSQVDQIKEPKEMSSHPQPANTIKFLPFRDSKLTHAIKEAFAYNVNLSVLINICEEPTSANETISSL